MSPSKATAPSAKKAASARSGNPAKAASAADFKSRKKGTPIELPSGLWVVARRVSLTSYLKTGDVPNALMEIVQEALKKGQAADVSKMVGVDNDEGVDLDMVNDMFEMVNQIVMEMVVTPKIFPLPIPLDENDEPIEDPTEEEVEDAKDDERLYIDEVDEEDQMFLFRYATGGTADVAAFREEARTGLAAVADGKVSGNGPVSTRRPRNR